MKLAKIVKTTSPIQHFMTEKMTKRKRLSLSNKIQKIQKTQKKQKNPPKNDQCSSIIGYQNFTFYYSDLLSSSFYYHYPLKQ